ncbi:IS4 family transposase [Xanthomonas populi]
MRVGVAIRLIAQWAAYWDAEEMAGGPEANTLWLGLRDVGVFVEGMRFARRCR